MMTKHTHQHEERRRMEQQQRELPFEKSRENPESHAQKVRRFVGCLILLLFCVSVWGASRRSARIQKEHADTIQRFKTALAVVRDGKSAAKDQWDTVRRGCKAYHSVSLGPDSEFRRQQMEIFSKLLKDLDFYLVALARGSRSAAEFDFKADPGGSDLSILVTYSMASGIPSELLLKRYHRLVGWVFDFSC